FLVPASEIVNHTPAGARTKFTGEPARAGLVTVSATKTLGSSPQRELHPRRRQNPQLSLTCRDRAQLTAAAEPHLPVLPHQCLALTHGRHSRSWGHQDGSDVLSTLGIDQSKHGLVLSNEGVERIV